MWERKRSTPENASGQEENVDSNKKPLSTSNFPRKSLFHPEQEGRRNKVGKRGAAPRLKERGDAGSQV